MGGLFSSLSNSNGPQGIKGDTGPQGIKGDTGTQGIKGDTGTQGIKGDTGPQGVKGDTGIQGVKGDKGDKGDKGETGSSGTFTLQQILSGGLDQDVVVRFVDALSQDPRFKGAIGPPGPSGSIANVSDLANQLLNDSSFKSNITGGIVKTADFNTFNNDYNSFKADVKTNYVKSGTTDATWWNNQLTANYGLYNTNKNDITKASTYVWNNFYNKTDADGKYALKSTDTNGYANKGDLSPYIKTADADGKYAFKTDVTNINLSPYIKTADADGKYALKTSIDLSPYIKTTDADNKYAKVNQNATFNDLAANSQFYVNSTKTYPDGGGVQRTPSLNIFSNASTNRDFVIANVTGGIGGGDITINPRWGGNVKIGYDPYGLDSNPSKDTNVPSSRLTVKGDINASDNLIAKGLKLGPNAEWNLSADANCLRINGPEKTQYNLCKQNVPINNSPVSLRSIFQNIYIGDTREFDKWRSVVNGGWTPGFALNSKFNGVNNTFYSWLMKYMQASSGTNTLISVSIQLNPNYYKLIKYLDIYFMVRNWSGATDKFLYIGWYSSPSTYIQNTTDVTDSRKSINIDNNPNQISKLNLKGNSNEFADGQITNLNISKIGYVNSIDNSIFNENSVGVGTSPVIRTSNIDGGEVNNQPVIRLRLTGSEIQNAIENLKSNYLTFTVNDSSGGPNGLWIMDAYPILNQ